jgi:hypothetical protein
MWARHVIADVAGLSVAIMPGQCPERRKDECQPKRRGRPIGQAGVGSQPFAETVGAGAKRNAKSNTKSNGQLKHGA